MFNMYYMNINKNNKNNNTPKYVKYKISFK